MKLESRIGLYLGLLLLHFSLKAHECNNCKSLRFIANKNQWHSNVCFKADVPFGAVFLEHSGYTFTKANEAQFMQLRYNHHRSHEFTPDFPDAINCHAIKVKFVGANTKLKISGKDSLSEYFNYFIGKDKSQWASRVPAFYEVEYANIYEGINLKVYSENEQPKFDWIVKAGFNQKSVPIKLKYEGQLGLKLVDGSLKLVTTVGEIAEAKPYAYQFIEGKKVEVPCEFAIEQNEVRFELPFGFNSKYDLVIDPALIFSTYSGSTADNFGYTATYDSRGEAYTAGSVFGFGYPTTAGAYQINWAGGSMAGTGGTDIGISKYNATGTQRIYSTYLGGRADELPHSLIVNTNDELFIFGTTSSNNFPVTPNAYDTTFNGGPDPGPFSGLGVHYVFGSDIVISRFSPDGTQLLASTYVGGTGNDGLNTSPSNFLRYNYADEVRGEIDIDKQDNIYLATCTRSADFPVTTGVFQESIGGGLDGIIIKMNNSLSTMVWCSFLGGEDDDAIYSLSLDKNDDLFVCGGARSVSSFPVSPSGVVQGANAGGRCDGFVTLVDKSGLAIKKSTFWGSAEYDQIYFVENDREDNVYVMGQTEAKGSFFINNAGYSNPNSGLFITKLDHDLELILWSTVIGAGRGVPDISPTAFLVDLCSKVYITGWGSSIGNSLSTRNLPVTSNAFSTVTDNQDFYMAVLNDDASGLFYATYFGSPTAQDHVDGGTSRYSKKGILYQSVCAGCGGVSNFPTTPGAVSRTNNSPNCNNAVYKFDFNIPLAFADFLVPDPPCQLPYTATFTNTSDVLGDADYLWIFSNGFTTTDSNAVYTFTQPGLYKIKLIARDTTTCNGIDSIEKQILILNNSTSTLPEITICKSAKTQIGIPPGSGNVTYQWQFDASLNETNVPNPFASPDSTTTYTLFVKRGNCTDTIRQTVVVFNDAIAVQASVATCPGDSVKLSANNSKPGQTLTYQWSPPSLILAGQGTANPLVSPPRDTTFAVVVTNQLGCTFSANVFVDIISKLPSLEAIAKPYTIRYGDTSQLALIADGVAKFNWEFDSTLSDTSSATPLAFPLETNVYKVFAEDSNGCKVSDTVIVYVFRTPCKDGGVFLPNAFSPNGDGKNDVLYVRSLRVTELYLAIYDRWGQLMFETNDQSKGWDGTYGGKVLDSGVFGFYMKARCDDGELIEKKGNISLLK